MADSNRAVRVIGFRENRGKRAAMAAGIRATRAAVVAFVDSDSSLERDALRKIVRGFADPRVGAIAGHAESLRDQPPQRDGEPTPQVRRPPLPHNLGGVVVAVEAQRLAQLGIVVAVVHQALQRVAVAAMAGAANWTSACLSAVHMPE